MPDMSSDQIRDLAVRCVEGFLNDKVPLSIGLAKEASANDLNIEQIKRACEVTNTVTHLKLMQLSTDRTIEYPLCKVAEVMAEIVRPELGSIEKTAATAEQVQEFYEQANASEEMSAHEQTLYFIKEAALNERALETLQDRAVVVQSQLVKLASEIRKDEAWLDKMSSINVDTFAELSILISGERTEPRDFGGACLFKEAELKQVKTLVDLYKEAKQIVAESAKRKDLCKRAEDLSQGMVKKAFLGQAMLGSAAKGIATGVGKTLATPIAAAGRAITTPITGAIRKGVNSLSSTSVGHAAGVVSKPLTTGQKRGLAAAGTLGTVGTTVGADALTYKASGGAGYNSMGSSKNVWDALQH